MKSTSHFIKLILILGFGNLVLGQDATLMSDISENDTLAQQISNTDTIPGFDSKPKKLKISGVVYESDGVTPAKDVIVNIDQADEHGNFEVVKENGKRVVVNSGTVKTNADGVYTFYTYIPGSDRRYNMQQQLFVFITESDNISYEIPSFLFDEDPLLSKQCRKRITKKGDPSRILKPTLVDGLNVVQKDIVLGAAVK